MHRHARRHAHTRARVYARTQARAHTHFDARSPSCVQDEGDAEPPNAEGDILDTSGDGIGDADGDADEGDDSRLS